MSKLQKKYSEFDRMSTEELEDLLRADFQISNNEATDMDAVLYIMSLIAARKKQTYNHEYPDAEQAWESFNKNYRSLPETLWSDNVDRNHCESLCGSSSKRKNRLWRCIAGVAAAVIIIVGCGSLTTQAVGCNLWEIIVQWTSETFGFGLKQYASQNEPSENANKQYDSLQAALNDYNIKEKVVPTWIPENFILSDIQVSETPEANCFTASYQNTNNMDEYITITIDNIQNDNYNTFEKDDSNVECFNVSGVEHYILSNLDYNSAIWMNGKNECSIIVPESVSYDELKHMIQSIYER